MAIDRYALVSRHNPVLEAPDAASPLTVGNGELAFTADCTGLQTLYKEYFDTCPLCTMSQWGWHTQPVSSQRYDYTLKDLVMTEFDYNGRKVIYPKEVQPGNEAVYEWLRKNPHRLNLARIGLEYEGEEISAERISHIRQELELYSGILKSSFVLEEARCRVETVCDSDSDTLGIRVESPLLETGKLALAIAFPYGSPDKSASDFESTWLHSTETLYSGQDSIILKRVLDKDIYYVDIHFADNGGEVQVDYGLHKVVLRTGKGALELSIGFGQEAPLRMDGAPGAAPAAMQQVKENSRRYWKEFWEKGALVQLHNSPDARAEELERRMILSLYLLTVNSCGSAPPQETGLTCNSWYGKMHMEMHFWHCAWAPLWGRTQLLEKSLPWYLQHIEQARENAARNGYRGARWPKMIALDGVDSPSAVAPMLLWQQPHIIFMLELCYRENRDEEFRRKYWLLVKETADFMADIVVYNKEKHCYELIPPVIPVQECHLPQDVLNPAFEVSYWRYALEIALRWARELGQEYDEKWEKVKDGMASLTMQDNVYLAHENCPATYTKYNHDHPSMLMSYGVLRDERLDEKVVKHTLEKVIECWDYPSLWGWDFAVMAMTAARLGDPEAAVDILLKDTPKNDYVISGNNRQKMRADLPLYLPGNGSLLLAIPMMAQGYEGCGLPHPGFPEGWVVEAEGLQNYI